MDLFVGFTLIAAIIVLIVGIVLLAVAYATKQKVKPPLIVIGVAVAMFVIGFGAAGIYNHHVEQQQAETRKIRAKLAKEDNQKFSFARTDFGNGAAKSAGAAEDLANKISSAWNDAIWEDKGAKVDGKYYTDFNEAIQAVLDSETSKQVDIADGEATMDKAMKVMKKHVTKKNESKLAKYQKLSKAVKKLDRLATSPSGNISDFNSSFTDADNAVVDILE